MTTDTLSTKDKILQAAAEIAKEVGLAIRESVGNDDREDVRRRIDQDDRMGKWAFMP